MVLPCYDPLCFLPLIQPLGKERSSNIDAFYALFYHRLSIHTLKFR